MGVENGVSGDSLGVDDGTDRCSRAKRSDPVEALQALGRKGLVPARPPQRLKVLAPEVPNRWQGEAPRAGRLS